MKYNAYLFFVILFCIHDTQSSWQNFLHPLVWWQNRLSSDVKEIISKAANADDTDENRTFFAQELIAALDNNPDDIQRGSLLLRIYKYCYKRKNDQGPSKKTVDMAYALIKAALEKGVNPNICGRKNKNIILKAHSYQDPILMDMLVEHNANLMIKDKDNEYIFHTQVKNNNKDMVTVFLKQKDISAHIDETNSHGETALIVATKRGSKDIVRLLLDHNAQPDLADQENNTPLFIATKDGFNDIAQLLLEYNANPNLPNYKSTPLHIAIEQDNTDLVTKLIAHNAVINSFDAQGNSTLLIACKKDNHVIIKLLIEHGADTVINKGNKQGEYPLFVIMHHTFKQKGDAHRNGLATIQSMLTYADTRLKDGSGHTLFTLASKYNALDVMDILKEHDPGLIDEPDKNGNTPLHNEAAAGSYDTVQYLIHYGAHINKPNKRGQTPLLYAMEHGKSDIATVLIAAGATINHVDNKGNTIWHYCAFANESTVTCNPILIDQASPLLNSKNNEGDTPLHIATYHGNITLIRFLLDHGSKIDVVNNKQQTVLHIAAQRSCDVLKLFLETNGVKQLINIQDQDGNTALHNAASAGNIKCLQHLLNMQATVDIKNNKGQTPFILSCISLQMATVRTLLLSKRVNPNKGDSKGYAGIHHIATSGNVNTLREFLVLAQQLKDKVYIDIDKQTKIEKQTALHIATREQYVQCVELLIKAGANVNIRDKDGNTPLHLACTTNPTICKLLLNSPNIKPNISNEKSLTPLHLAIQKRADSCIDVLVQCPDVNPNCDDDAQRTPMYYAFYSPNPVEYIAKLLRHDRIKPNYLKPDEPSLHAAFDKDNVDLMILLLANERIDLDIPNKEDLTIWERARLEQKEQKFFEMGNIIRNSGDISWTRKEKIRQRIEKLKNPPPVNPEYTSDKPVPLYPVLPPTVYVQPTAPPAEEVPQSMPPAVNPEWDGKESFDTSYSAKAS